MPTAASGGAHASGCDRHGSRGDGKHAARPNYLLLAGRKITRSVWHDRVQLNPEIEHGRVWARTEDLRGCQGSGLLLGIKIIFLRSWKLPLRRMVVQSLPDVPSKGFFLNQFWSNFYLQKNDRKKHQKSFDPPVDQVLHVHVINFY